MTETENFLRWLVEDNGYYLPVEVPGGRYVCLNVRRHNTQILVGQIGNRFGWDNAW
jgi:hypothetical protein